MKTLIWTTAFGDEIYTDMARELVKSARKHGYHGDFVVISDKPCEVDGAVVRVDTEGMAKAAIRRHVTLSDYEYICFVDADCVFNENPESLFGPNIVLAFEANEITKRNGLFLSEEQQSIMDAVSVNSGFFCLAGEIAETFLLGWETTWKACPIDEARKSADCYKDSTLDQPALQKFLMDSGVEYEIFYGVEMPYVWPSDEERQIIHFCGPINNGKSTSLQNKRVVLGEMKERNGEYHDKTLLYTIAFGDDVYYRMTEEMIWSARREGYKGQIAVLCDKEWVFPGAATTLVVNRDSGRLLKTQIREQEPLESFDYVLYADSDIIWTQNPSKMMTGDKPRVARGPTLLHSAPATNAFMTVEEKLKAQESGAHGINTGTVCVPGKQSEAFFEVWESKWSTFDKSPLQDVWAGKAPDYQLYDEAALWVMILRGEIDAEIMPKEEVFFPVMHAIPNLKYHFGYENPDYDYKAVCAHFVATSLRLDHAQILEAMRVSTAENMPLVVQKFAKDIQALEASLRGNPEVAALKKEVERLTLAVCEMGRILREIHGSLEAKGEKTF